MKTLTRTYAIKAPITSVWKALIDPTEIDKWDGGPAVMDDRIGTTFSLWDGSITGKNLEVEAPHRLKQEWIAGEWPQPSIVTFSLSEKNGQTIIDLVHQQIPDSDAKDIDDGWKLFYLGAIKKYLEKN